MANIQIRVIRKHALIRAFMVCGGLVVSVLDCQSKGSGFKSRPEQKFGSTFLFHLRPLANSAMTSTLTIYCKSEDETARERTGQPPSYSKAKKMKSLILPTHGCPRASLRDSSSSSSNITTAKNFLSSFHWGQYKSKEALWKFRDIHRQRPP